jgi:hypothetical protein
MYKIEWQLRGSKAGDLGGDDDVRRSHVKCFFECKQPHLLVS